MHVRLKNTFYAGPRYGRFKPAARKQDTVYMPDELFDILPSTAEVMEGKVEVVPGEAERIAQEKLMEDIDNDRAASDALVEAEKQAEETRLSNARKLQLRLEAEASEAEAVIAEKATKAAASKAKATAKAKARKNADKDDFSGKDDFEAEDSE